MKKKLAIICANFDQLPLVQKAKEMGLETHCFAWDNKDDTGCKEFADYYHPISILEKEQILEKCKEIEIDGITSIINDYAVPTVAYVAQNMGLPGNRYEDMAVACNKFKARQAFFNNGLNSPSFTIASIEKYPDLKGFHFPLIVKPTDRCASVGVKKVDNEAELKEAIFLAQQLSYSHEAIIEEFLTGYEVTIDMISWQGKHYPIMISDTETTGAPNYIKIGYHQQSQLSADIQAIIINEAEKALSALKFDYGISDTEVIVTETGEIKIIEMNPRMGSDYTEDLIKLSTGYDLVKAVIDVAMGHFEIPKFHCKNYSGVYYCKDDTYRLKQAIENKEKDSEIIEAALYSEEDKHFGRIGYLIYQSKQKKDWKDN